MGEWVWNQPWGWGQGECRHPGPTPQGCEPFVSTCTYWAQFPGHWVSGLLRWVRLSPSSWSAPEGEGAPRCSQTPAFCGDRACLAPHPGPRGWGS